MTRHSLKFAFVALLGASIAGYAQAPSGSPTGSTGQCKDGTYTSAHTKRGACKGHQGVKTWYATVGGPTNPDIKGGTGSQNSSAKQTAKSDEVVNPHGTPPVSGARANAINKKSGNAAVVTPNNGGKVIPGPAATGSANSNAAASGGQASAAGGATAHAGRNTAKGSSSGALAGREAAPGGGPDMVWLNTKTNVYHCYGTAYYGKTKSGKYVSEKDARNAGAKPDHGKTCSAQ